MFIARENKMTEMVHPVIIATMILYQCNITTPEDALILKLL